MKNLFIILSASFLLSFYACDSNSLRPFDNQNCSKIDLYAEHDKYCKLVCDSIYIWQKNNELTEDKISILWNVINIELSKSLSISKDSVSVIFASLNINSENWTRIRTDKYPLLDINYQLFFDDLENVFIENEGLEDSELIALFNVRGEYWKQTLDSCIVNNTVEIAKSSYIYWNNNFDSCINSNSSLRRNLCAIKKVAAGDGVGALWGSLGGPGGALVGAVGGTLGAVVSGAVFGWGNNEADPDGDCE